MRRNATRTVSALAVVVALGACGDYSRVENPEPGDEEKPAIVPEREDREGAGLASPTPPDVMDPEHEDRDGDGVAGAPSR